MQPKTQLFATLCLLLVFFTHKPTLAQSEPSLAAQDSFGRFASVTMRQPNAQNHTGLEADTEVIQIAPPLTSAHSMINAPPRALGYNGIWISGATIDLYGDNDGDGYYQSFILRFDPDSVYGRTRVVATIHIRDNFSGWNHFYTTDPFTIESDSSWDVTEISARVIGGYPTNEYDLLISLYDAGCCNSSTPLLTFSPPILTGLTLEDEDYDYASYSGRTPSFYGDATVAGAIHPAILITLVGFFICRNTKLARLRNRSEITSR